MKNLSYTLFLAVALTVFFISCQKNTPNTDPNSPDNGPVLTGCRLNSLKTADSETKMTYDTKGNLIVLSDFQNNSKISYTEFTYTSSQIVEKLYDGSTGALQGTAYYTLGNNGLPQYVVSSGGYGVDSTYYTYDTNGYLTKLKKVNYTKNGNVIQLSYTLTEEYTITNGNRTHQKETMRGDYNYDRDIDYEFYADQPYYTGINGDYPFLGKTNISLLKKMSYTENNYTTIVSYQYQFDAGNRPVKLSSTISGSTDVTTTTIGYLCN